ncbi:hypothetical protein EKN56_06060 [Limnobaculum zhutongyuii]|uniref:Putative tail fiber protein gp53-like C-terminal domain-containing protein n=1 Tax=Limnobaculum zhutongyuii TaxID=2498113 RepID=A0A411WIJ1_9GAMM|nr:hypothetical protein [Limnobaculum zhutongyuii]QBH96002.1 hypothetical protein EKN56_06060 [Limnobaculum zhutongyuii]TQS89287.1 hypothetical protein ELQ32_05860 [Limnobaculum zhutongyuii]
MKDIMPPINTPDSLFHDGNPLTGALGTVVNATFMNDVQGSVQNIQTELKALLTATDSLPNDNVNNQILLALKALFLQANNNLSEIKDAGVTAIETARGNLGLKSAAIKEVGTGIGQIPDMSSQQKGVGAGFGWQKLPSGLILQWGGTPAIAGSGSSVNVSFPVAFPTAVVGVVFQSTTEVSPSCALFMHTDLTTVSMKVWGVAKVVAAGATVSPLSPGISASWLVWGY